MTERSTKGDQNMGQTSHQEKLNSDHSLGKILTDGKHAGPAMISPCRDFNGKERIRRQVYVEHKVGKPLLPHAGEVKSQMDLNVERMNQRYQAVSGY